MKSETYFLVRYDGVVFRKEINADEYPSLWQKLPMKLAQESNLIIKLTPFGRGYSVKNRYSEKRQYFTRNQMVMLSLQAETF